MSSENGECFAVLIPYGEDNSVIYGRNAFSSKGEVSEVLYFPAQDNESTQKCSFMTMDGAPSFAVILNRSAKVWGADSGANEKGVCIGISWSENETENSILATDLTRLGLERSSSASEAVSIMSTLLEKYGSNREGKDASKCCFLICDTKEAWLFNSVGTLWAAEKITSGFKNTPFGLSITTKIDKSSENLQAKAEELGLWDGNGDFDFTKSFSPVAISTRPWPGSEPSSEGNFTLTDMFNVLRSDTENGKSVKSSHISILSSNGICCHWFTATPNPKESVFKPFVFTPGVRISPLTIIDADKDDEATLLFKYHKSRNWESIGDLLKFLEETCVAEVEEVLAKQDGQPSEELDELMKDCVEAEVKFYR